MYHMDLKNLGVLLSARMVCKPAAQSHAECFKIHCIWCVAWHPSCVCVDGRKGQGRPLACTQLAPLAPRQIASPSGKALWRALPTRAAAFDVLLCLERGIFIEAAVSMYRSGDLAWCGAQSPSQSSYLA